MVTNQRMKGTQKSRYLWFLNRSRWEKSVIIVVGLIFLGIAGFSFFGNKTKTPQYQTMQVQKDTIISTVSESGNVTAASQVSVTSPSTGLIQEVYVKNGDTVSQGQNLFSVKAVATPQQQASALASYESALANLQSAQQTKLSLQANLEKDRQAVLDAQNAEDYKNSHNDNPATKTSYTDLEKKSIDSSLINARESFNADETKYNQSDTSIAAANASLTSANLNYQATKDSVVTAPASGTIANLAASQGNYITASSNNSSSSTSSNSSSNSNSSTTGSIVLVIGNFSQLSIVAAVSEVDIAKIKTGQKATVTLDALSGKTYVGQVHSVDSVGTISSGVVTYNVSIALVSPPAEIHSGMTASVVIQTDRKDDVISVPTAAVSTATDGTQYVRVMKNDKVSQVTVTTGITSDTNTEITSGLSEGDTVVTSVVSSSTSTSSTSTSPFSGLNRGFGGFGGGGGNTRTSTTRTTTGTRN